MTRYRLDSQFHCSYLESRGVPEKNAGNTGKKSAGNYLPFISGVVISCNATSGYVTSGDVISGHAYAHFQHIHKCCLSCAHILLVWHVECSNKKVFLVFHFDFYPLYFSVCDDGCLLNWCD